MSVARTALACGLIFLAFLPVPAADAQSPPAAPSVRLPAEIKGDPGAFLRVPAETAGKEVRWFSADSGLQLFPVDLLKDSRTAVVTATAPGRYRLLAWTAVNSVPSEAAVCVIVIGQPPVPPTPPDPPVPPDPPKPQGPLWLVAIEETTEATAKRAAFLTDKALLERIKSKGHHWKLVDKDCKDKDGNPTADLAPWLKRAKDKGYTLPCLFLVTANGTVLFEGAAPASPGELVKLLEAKGG